MGLIDFIKTYCAQKFLRLHVPGHQGRCNFLNKHFGALFDITEIKGADWLFESSGLIGLLERELADLFGQNVALSTCGSTLCVQTMVALCRNKRFIFNRENAHISFINAISLLNVKSDWFNIKNCAKDFNDSKFFNEIKIRLEKFEKGTCAVFLTYPNYYGEFVNIYEIVALCKEKGAVLVVDSAHGAHLNFTKSFVHPAKIGAHLSCSSLHKTLPALTGAAVLTYDSEFFSKRVVKSVMSLFSTTSPSYMTMASIDYCVSWLKKKGVKSFTKLECRKQNLINSLKNVSFLKTDVCKLVVDCRNNNLSGFEVAELFRKNRIEPEFANDYFVVLVLSPFLNFFDWFRLRQCLKKINFSKKQNQFKKPCCFVNNFFDKELTKSVLEAVSSDFEVVDVKNAVGRICAKTYFKTPPGTVAILAGERISLEMVEVLKSLNIAKIEVLTGS